MTTMADITAGLIHFDPLFSRICPRCQAEHHRVDYLCEECRTKDTRNKRAAGLKGQRVLKRMRAARAADPVPKPIDHPGDSPVMLRSLLARVGIREAGEG